MNNIIDKKSSASSTGEEKQKKVLTNLFKKQSKRFMFLIGQVLMVFTAIILINFIGNFLARKNDFKFDLTTKKLYSLSPQAKSYLKNYDRKIKFLILEPFDPCYYLDSDAIRRSEIIAGVVAANPNFEIEFFSSLGKLRKSLKDVEMLEYTDIDGKAMLRKEARIGTGFVFIVDETDATKPRGVAVKCNILHDRARLLLPLDEFIIYSKYGSEQWHKKIARRPEARVCALERGLVGALEKLADSKLIRVSATTGHGERDFSNNSVLFNSIGAKIEKTNLVNGELSPEKQLLLIAAPRLDFKDDELNRVDEFLNNGGKLIYFASAGQKKLEKLDAFLQARGIEFSEGCVVGVEKDQPSALIGVDLENQNNAYTEKMVEKNLPLLLKGCRPMTLQPTKNGWQAFEICKTAKKCVAVTKDSANDVEEIKKAPKSEFLVVGGAQKELDSGKVAKIVAVSCVDVLNGANTITFGKEPNPHFQEFRVTDAYLTSNNNFIYSLLKETSAQPVFDYIPTKIVEGYNNDLDFRDNSKGEPIPKEQEKFFRKMINSAQLLLPLICLVLWAVSAILRRRNK